MTSTIAVDRSCRPFGNLPCEERAGELLGGGDPAAHARVQAKHLPFDVRIVPLESDVLEQSGYRLSFDFANRQELRAKLIPMKTAPLRVSDATFEANTAGGFTFSAEVALLDDVKMDYDRSLGTNTTFAVVLPGLEGTSNADLVESTPHGTRFQWNWAHPSEPDHGLPPEPFQASTCIHVQTNGTPSLHVVFHATVMVALAVWALVLVRRNRGTRSRASRLTPGRGRPERSDG